MTIWFSFGLHAKYEISIQIRFEQFSQSFCTQRTDKPKRRLLLRRLTPALPLLILRLQAAVPVDVTDQ